MSVGILPPITRLESTTRLAELELARWPYLVEVRRGLNEAADIVRTLADLKQSDPPSRRREFESVSEAIHAWAQQEWMHSLESFVSEFWVSELEAKPPFARVHVRDASAVIKQTPEFEWPCEEHDVAAVFLAAWWARGVLLELADPMVFWFDEAAEAGVAKLYASLLGAIRGGDPFSSLHGLTEPQGSQSRDADTPRLEAAAATYENNPPESDKHGAHTPRNAETGLEVTIANPSVAGVDGDPPGDEMDRVRQFIEDRVAAGDNCPQIRRKVASECGMRITDRTVLQTDAMRAVLEQAIKERKLKQTDLAAQIGTNDRSLRAAIKFHGLNWYARSGNPNFSRKSE